MKTISNKRIRVTRTSWWRQKFNLNRFNMNNDRCCHRFIYVGISLQFIYMKKIYICLNTNESMTSSRFARRLTLDIWLVQRCDVPAVVDHQLFRFYFATVAELRFVFVFILHDYLKSCLIRWAVVWCLIFNLKTIESRQIRLMKWKHFHTVCSRRHVQKENKTVQYALHRRRDSWPWQFHSLSFPWLNSINQCKWNWRWFFHLIRTQKKTIQCISNVWNDFG